MNAAIKLRVIFFIIVKIKISIANQEYVSPIIDGVADFNITGLAAGTYENVSVVYNGDIHFNGNSTNTTFIVSPSTKDKIDVNLFCYNFKKSEVR